MNLLLKPSEHLPILKLGIKEINCSTSMPHDVYTTHLMESNFIIHLMLALVIYFLMYSMVSFTNVQSAHISCLSLRCRAFIEETWRWERNNHSVCYWTKVCFPNIVIYICIQWKRWGGGGYEISDISTYSYFDKFVLKYIVIALYFVL